MDRSLAPPGANGPVDLVLHVFCECFVSASAIANALPMLFLSYPSLFNPILSYPNLSYPNLSYAILSYPTLSYPILSYAIYIGGWGVSPNREIVSFRCVRAGEAKLRERVGASVSLFARLQNRISLAVPCPVCPRRCFIFLRGLSGTSRLIRTSRSFCACPF